MPPLSEMTVDQVRQRLQLFSRTYVEDWAAWLHVDRKNIQQTASLFGQILRRWQACRPNAMRRPAQQANHDPPFLEHLVAQCGSAVQALGNFEMNNPDAVVGPIEQALTQLWQVLMHLSFRGCVRGGLAGVVGISKATLLLTEGRVGPAFDSVVRRHLGIGPIADCGSWVSRIRNVAGDIGQFESNQGLPLREAAPEEFRAFHRGRLYDMVFGPEQP
jgi:hypothetical protein